MKSRRKSIPIIGEKFGEYTVISDQTFKKGKDNHLYFKVQCSCGKEQFIIPRLLYDNLQDCCKSCSSKRASKTNPGCINFKGPDAIRVGDLTLSMYNSYKRGASQRGYEWDEEITMEYLIELLEKQNHKCALTGQDINIKYDNEMVRRKQVTASLDRIDSNIGYTKDNIQWVNKEINRFKNNYSQELFIEMCKLVSNHANQQPSQE